MENFTKVLEKWALSQVWVFVENHSSWEMMGLYSYLMWLESSMMSDNWMVSGGSQ